MEFYLLLLLIIAFLGVLKVQGSGFEVELIHRDSPLSPVYNHSTTPEERARDAAYRSLARYNRMTTKSVTVDSVVHPGHDGSFLIKLSIGTPPTTTYAILDTGSDLAWVQCSPCQSCFAQESPVYDSEKSSTYHPLPCNGPACNALPPRGKMCSSTSVECTYEYIYADSSISRGMLASETFTFQTVNGGGEPFSNVVFGCGHDNDLLYPNLGSGVIGLGRGFLSLISQFGSNMEKKFSYCLPESPEFASNLKIGMNASLFADKMVSTPLLYDEIYPSFYFLNIEGITVGNKKIVNERTTPGKGNTVIDSGSTLTYLEPELYTNVVSTMKESINLEAVQDPNPTFSLCYESKAFSRIPEQSLVFHFTGADIELKNVNVFMSFNDITCLAMKNSLHGFSVYGNLAQKNFQVEYNLEQEVISFAPANCSQYPWKAAAGGRPYPYSLLPSVICITFVYFMYSI